MKDILVKLKNAIDILVSVSNELEEVKSTTKDNPPDDPTGGKPKP
jgi:hypothetical protein